MTSPESHDVVILGAGISGICAAVHLIKQGITDFIIVDRGASFGGTWASGDPKDNGTAINGYPGLRSDSDCFTFLSLPGVKLWHKQQWFGDAREIYQFLDSVVTEFDLRSKMRMQLLVSGADWSDSEQMWTTTATSNNNDKNGSNGNNRPVVHFKSRFIICAAGYYSYDKPCFPTFPGQDDFLRDPTHKIVHPQLWPKGLDYSGKRVAVIGSGATAVTIVPAMLEEKTANNNGCGPAASVTMVQRSPSYMIAVPQRGGWQISLWMRFAWLLGNDAVSWLVRVTIQLYLTLLLWIIKSYPNWSRGFLQDGVERFLGKDMVRKHFTPSYAPWDQRLCAVPSGDFFKVIKGGKASIVTDKIKTLDAKGIVLEKEGRVDADLIVAATGLELQCRGGIRFTKNNGAVEIPNDSLLYRGCMVDRAPNLFTVFGYLFSSWTQKSDLIGKFAAAKIAYMKKHGYTSVTPVASDDVKAKKIPFTDMTSNYLVRGKSELPTHSEVWPWCCYQNYLKDRVLIGWAPNEDAGHLQFVKAESSKTK